MKVAVCALAGGNDVAAARRLAQTLAAFHPDWPLTVLVTGGMRPALRGSEEAFAIVTPGQLEGPELLDRLAVVPPPVAAVLLRPLLVQHVARGGADAVLLLPADAEVHGPLAELVDALHDADAVLVPRLTGRLPDDGCRPDGHDLLEAGEYDDAIVGVRTTEPARELVDWWLERGRESTEAMSALRPRPGGVAHPGRLGASPLGAARSVFDRLAVLDHPGYAVSHWNLHERPLARTEAGLSAAGQPLRLMRFAGFRPDRPWWLSEHASRVLVLDDPLLEQLCGERASALLEAGWITALELQAAAGDELPNGLRFDERLRRLYADAADSGEDFGDVMSPQGAEAFESWLRDPAPIGAAAGINRYCYDVWRHRPDVQEAYPDLDGGDAEGFAGWLWVHGRPELRLPPALLPPPPAWFDAGERALPSVSVTGYLRGNLGLGQAARGYVSALQAAGVPVATRTVATDPPVDGLRARRRPDEREFAELPAADGTAADVNLLCVNADQLPGLAAELGEAALRSSYVIGQWAWETDVIPERWDAAFDVVDEVWVYTTYVAEQVGRAADVPVVVVPLPVEPPDAAGARVPFELPDGFVFLFSFDFFSTLQRKNPLGLVEAFRRAFAPGEGPVLLLKTINAEFRPEAREQLRHAIGGRPDISHVDSAIAPREMAALFARADCFASLHRSEGFGLGPAEAMALGKPVVATGFSGTTDFMTPANSFLVDWQPTLVGPDAEHYPAEGTWAEPSIEHAAALLREVWLDQEQARMRGARAARDIAAALSPAAVGAIARARLERIAARRRGRGDEQLAWPLRDVEARLGFDLDGAATDRSARSLARRAALRAIRPYTRSERSLDEAVAGSLRRLHLDLEAERAARRRDRDRIARLERRLAELTARRDG